MKASTKFIALGGAIALAYFIMVLGVAAHSTYDPWCCNGDDCKPYHGVVETRPDGYYLPEFDQTIPYKNAQGTRQYAPEAGTRYDPPPIGEEAQAEYHICILPWEPGKIRCFYAKIGGV